MQSTMIKHKYKVTEVLNITKWLKKKAHFDKQIITIFNLHHNITATVLCQKLVNIFPLQRQRVNCIMNLCQVFVYISRSYVISKHDIINYILGCHFSAVADDFVSIIYVHVHIEV